MNTIVGWSLILSAVWWVLQMAFVTTFFAIGQPYGSLSDLSVALNVILLLPLALCFHIHTYPSQPLLSTASTVVGTAGVASAAVASLLIMAKQDQLRAVPAASYGRVRCDRYLAAVRIDYASPPGNPAYSPGQRRHSGGHRVGGNRASLLVRKSQRRLSKRRPLVQPVDLPAVDAGRRRLHRPAGVGGSPRTPAVDDAQRLGTRGYRFRWETGSASSSTSLPASPSQSEWR